MNVPSSWYEPRDQGSTGNNNNTYHMLQECAKHSRCIFLMLLFHKPCKLSPWSWEAEVESKRFANLIIACGRTRTVLIHNSGLWTSLLHQLSRGNSHAQGKYALNIHGNKSIGITHRTNSMLGKCNIWLNPVYSTDSILCNFWLNSEATKGIRTWSHNGSWVKFRSGVENKWILVDPE